MPEQPIQLEESSFVTHSFTADISQMKFSFRVLKMVNSVFIYIGQEGNEVLDEVAVAMQSRNNEVIATTAIGPLLGCESQELAQKLSRRLQTQVFVSCNVPVDRMLRPLLEKRLVDEIKDHSEYFK